MITLNHINMLTNLSIIWLNKIEVIVVIKWSPIVQAALSCLAELVVSEVLMALRSWDEKGNTQVFNCFSPKVTCYQSIVKYHSNGRLQRTHGISSSHWLCYSSTNKSLKDISLYFCASAIIFCLFYWTIKAHFKFEN